MLAQVIQCDARPQSVNARQPCDGLKRIQCDKQNSHSTWDFAQLPLNMSTKISSLGITYGALLSKPNPTELNRTELINQSLGCYLFPPGPLVVVLALNQTPATR